MDQIANEGMNARERAEGERWQEVKEGMQSLRRFTAIAWGGIFFLLVMFALNAALMHLELRGKLDRQGDTLNCVHDAFVGAGQTDTPHDMELLRINDPNGARYFIYHGGAVAEVTCAGFAGFAK